MEKVFTYEVVLPIQVNITYKLSEMTEDQEQEDIPLDKADAINEDIKQYIKAKYGFEVVDSKEATVLIGTLEDWNL